MSVRRAADLVEFRNAGQRLSGKHETWYNLQGQVRVDSGTGGAVIAAEKPRALTELEQLRPLLRSSNERPEHTWQMEENGDRHSIKKGADFSHPKRPLLFHFTMVCTKA